MPRHKVLIVEDEHDIAGLIKHTLERGGDADAEIVSSGDAALAAVTEQPPDLIILDLNLPVINGLDVCRILRSRADVPHVPIIMLTARTSEDDRVAGLEHGADDYVTKPFSLRELTARVRAVLRRGRSARDDRAMRATLYRGERLSADFDAVAISVDGAPGALDAPRVRAAAVSGQNKNRVISRDRLLERVWGYERLVETRSVDVHVGRLRSKLKTRAARSRRWSDWGIASSIDCRLANRFGYKGRLTPCVLRGAGEEDSDGRTRAKLQEHPRLLPAFHFFVLPSTAAQCAERSPASVAATRPKGRSSSWWSPPPCSRSLSCRGHRP
jgi:DNA-binding response OmpR family regulator